MREFTVRYAVLLTVGVLARLLTAWILGKAVPAPALADLVRVVDYLLAGIIALAVIALGWWAGTTGYTRAAGWIDRRMATGLRRWRDTPRSRWSDALYVNAVATFVVRVGNLAVRPAWRRTIGMTAAVVAVGLTLMGTDAATAAIPDAAANSATDALHRFIQRYADVASAVGFVGGVCLVGNVLYISWRSMLGRRP
ncbi:hypothetical protein [Dactylosporangium sp. CA-092794]|uniref:hypothetical protein n=1 Tax=Dactylosporangium sp. CA-092794 TaxID=3239929 RepID=UPI003D8FA8AA